jgi:hypothetical protein
MGYQRVDVRFEDGREIKDAVVLNAALLEVPEEFANVTIVDIRPHQPRS